MFGKVDLALAEPNCFGACPKREKRMRTYVKMVVSDAGCINPLWGSQVQRGFSSAPWWMDIAKERMEAKQGAEARDCVLCEVQQLHFSYKENTFVGGWGVSTSGKS